jgi:hypothetical protein
LQPKEEIIQEEKRDLAKLISEWSKAGNPKLLATRIPLHRFTTLDRRHPLSNFPWKLYLAACTSGYIFSILSKVRSPPPNWTTKNQF